jgi:uncharacterized protein
MNTPEIITPDLSFFVTGGTGFIGFELIRELRQTYPTATIYGLCRNEKQSKKFLPYYVTPVIGDLKNPEGFQESLLKSQWVFHLGANASFSSSVDYTVENFEPTKKLIDILKTSSTLQRFIFTSTIGAVDRSKNDDCATPLNAQSPCFPSSEYGQSKLACEEYLKESGLPYTIMRPAWVYGAEMRRSSHIAVLSQKALDRSLLARIFFPGKVSVIHVSDMARMLVAIMKSPATLNKIYFGDDGTPRSFGEIFQIASSEGGIEKKSMWKIPSFFQSILIQQAHFFPFTLRCLFQNVLTCSEPLPSECGFSSKKTFTEGMKETVAYVKHRDHGYHLVTGAASGIGLAYVEELVRRGKKVLLVDRSFEVEAIAKNLEQESYICDLSSTADVEKLVRYTQEREWFVEGLINCAGIGFKGLVEEHSSQQIERMISVNVTALTQLCAAYLPEMKRRNNGYIMNIASSVSTVPLPGMALYAATKAAVRSLGLSLWGEVQGTAVKMLTVLPSGTKTHFQQSSGVRVLRDGKGLLSPQVVVMKSFNALEKGKIITFIGMKSLPVILLGKLFPAKLEVLYWKMMLKSAR